MGSSTLESQKKSYLLLSAETLQEFVKEDDNILREPTIQYLPICNRTTRQVQAQAKKKIYYKLLQCTSVRSNNLIPYFSQLDYCFIQHDLLVKLNTEGLVIAAAAGSTFMRTIKAGNSTVSLSSRSYLLHYPLQQQKKEAQLPSSHLVVCPRYLL